MRYILGVLGIILVLFLVITLIFRGGDSGTSVQNSAKIMKLTDYADKNSSVSLTTVGKMVGQEDRRAVRVVVTPNERRLEILSGYEETVMSSQTYANTPEAYTNFLSALNNLGFLNSRKVATDSRGVCPIGNRYIYDLSQDGNHLSNLWQTSCDSSGTFTGRGSNTRQLFQQQIPDYTKQIQSVKL